MNLIQSKKLILILIAIMAIYSILAFMVLPPESFFAGDEGVKFIQTKSLIKNNYRNLSLYYPGRNIDKENKFFPLIPPYAIEREGQMFSQWPVLFPLLSSLPFKIFKHRGLYIIPVLSSIFVFLVISRFVRFLTGKDSFIAPLLAAFATPLFFYSFTFWEHTMGTLFAVLSIYFFVIGTGEFKAWRMIISGVCIGFGIWVRNELYFLVLGLVIAGIIVLPVKSRSLHFKSYTYFFMGLISILLPMWLLQWITLGEFLGADVSQFAKTYVVTEATPFKGNLILFLIYKVKLAVVLILHRFKNEWMALLGLPYLLLVLFLVFPKLKGKNILFYLSISGILFISMFAFSQNLLNSGLLTNVPLLVLSLFILPIYKHIEKGEVSFFIFLVSAFYIFLIAVFAPATGGMQWGPRFMLPALPLLLVIIEKIWHHRREVIARIDRVRLLGIFAAFLILISLTVQIFGVTKLYQDRARDEKLLYDIRRRPENIFVTDSFWFPQEMAALYDTKSFFFVKNADGFRLLVEKLYRREESSFAYVTKKRGKKYWLNRMDFGARQVEKKSLPSGFLLRSFVIDSPNK